MLAQRLGYFNRSSSEACIVQANATLHYHYLQSNDQDLRGKYSNASYHTPV